MARPTPRRRFGAIVSVTLVGCAAGGLPLWAPGGGDGADLGSAHAPFDMAHPRDLAQPGAAARGDLAAGPNADLSTPPDLSSARDWTVLLGPGVWTSLVNTAAVDSRERLYVSDGSSIFVVQNASASVYLSGAAIAAASPDGSDAVQSLDVGPDDTLYFLSGTRIFGSSGAGQVSLLHELKGPYVHWLGVVDANRMIVFDYYLGGAEAVTPAGEALLYDGGTVMGATDCAAESVATQRDGVFFYLPGCNEYPLVAGNFDGSGAAVLLQSTLTPRLYADNFESVTRNPTGGFVANVENDAGSWNQALIQIAEDGSWYELPTNPPMGTFVNQIGDIFEFHARPVAVGPSGAIYLVGRHSIYRAGP